ncbi:hypothetical protein KTH89_24735, partial [Lachnospiraceae bacterium ASD5720]|nr:hypothetical protein [Diplocloster agilis]
MIIYKRSVMHAVHVKSDGESKASFISRPNVTEKISDFRGLSTRPGLNSVILMYLENYTLKNQLKNLNSRDWKQALLQRRQPKKTETSRHPRLKKDLFEPIQRIRENQEPRPIPITL